MSSNSKSNVYKIKASIDCPNCALKIENALRTYDDIEYALFDFEKEILTVKGNISSEEIKKRAIKADDDIVFGDEYREYVFSVSIDCPNCAKKIERSLNDFEGIESAIFDFPNGKLKVKTILKEDEIIKIAKHAGEDIEFLDSKNKKEKRDYTLIRVISSLVFLAFAFILNMPLWAIFSYIIAGYDVVLKAIKNMMKGKFFDENFLMMIATLGALAIATYEEASGVMILYQIGEYFQKRATNKSRESIAELFDLTPDFVTVLKDGKEVLTKADSVSIGSIISIKPGEKIAIDGKVISGTTFLDTKALTGESLPVEKQEGNIVLSGSVNLTGHIEIETTELYKDSTAAKIIKLTRESEDKKAKSELFISKFSKYYTPIVTITALALAFIPPLFGIRSLSESIYSACTLLVISCPCALVLSVPLTYFASIGCFAKHGILLKGAGTIEMLKNAKNLAIDKTGTLTEGVFEVVEFKVLDEVDESFVKSIAYTLESKSSHPIAKAIADFTKGNSLVITDIKEIPGIGVFGTYNNDEYSIGNSRILNENAISNIKESSSIIAKNGTPIAQITLSDKIKSSSFKAIGKLRKCGLENIIMLSGDKKESALSVSEKLGLDACHYELLPQEKLEILEELIETGTTIYTGDGINDAPSLMRADVGIAMGNIGSDIAIVAADAVILNDSIEKIADAISISKRSDNIVKENIALSISVKAIVFALAILGMSNMWLAVFADTGVALIALINAMRAMRIKNL